ncbi:myeloid cell surface antigen CD33-like [Dendropsophus ebraccatus]|uniref:myeloid cell surface antigen CD33-like n=1 Tax=Dendropsophus ebraccatus TaxID=150705 RepID=UPI003831175E
MKSLIDRITLVFLGIVLPGYFAESQVNWTFTLPDSIEASVHSTVEIPCTFSAPEEPGNFLLTWYMIDRYGGNDHQQVYNSNDSRKVSEEYRGRTTLIGHGNNCTLRITDVTYTAWYYPEISGGSFNFSNELKPVRINVRGCLNRSSCSEWSFSFPRTIKALSNSCVVIPCTLTHPDKAMDFNLLWFERSPRKEIEVFNNKTPSSIDRRYKERTFLFRIRKNICSLIINNVRKDGQYYPGITRNINAYNLEGRFCTVTVSDVPPDPVIIGAENLKDFVATKITCAVNHTCPLIRPSLEWNIPINTTMTHVNLTRGNWELHSEMTYIPSLKDNNRSLECTVTFPNGQKSVHKLALRIEAGSTSVVVIVVIAGVASLLLLLLLIFIYKRMKTHQPQAKDEAGTNGNSTIENGNVARLYENVQKI